MGLILTTVGKKSLEGRIIIALIYLLLIIGGTTMVYPFLIMISGSFKSDVDINDYDVIPGYFFGNEVLFRKYLESKYNESLTNYNINTRQNEFGFQKINPPEKKYGRRISDWTEFLQNTDMPVTYSIVGHSISVGNRLLPQMARGFREWLQKECNGDIETYNHRYDANIETWLQVYAPNMEIDKRKFNLTGSGIESAFLKYKSQQPYQYLYFISLDGKYVQDFLYYRYGKNIEIYNQTHGTNYKDYSQVFLTSRLPENEKEQEGWTEFVRNELNLQFIQVSPEAKKEFIEFLTDRYKGDITVLNKAYGTNFNNFNQVPYPEDVLRSSERLVDWDLFIREVSPKYVSVTSPETLWRDFLKDRYSSDISILNQAHEASYESFDNVPMPTKEIDYADMLKNRRHLRWEFASRNYKMVIQYLILHGRGIFNTVVFCVLSTLIALIVNPLAAYAMSRFNIPLTYKILLFLIATMAFPPMVTTIPNFLLLKQLGLLNTFWALILPGMVNGYMIFLLKGFFDSLPRELYESAMIEGASEWVMFWNITMTLSKPILAVISLGAFTAAYGSFMFAFIVCQDQKMWTLMVWLYQLQQFSHQAVTFAALIIAAIPTFLIFVFCQKIIMQGIVVPVEK